MTSTVINVNRTIWIKANLLLGLEYLAVCMMIEYDVFATQEITLSLPQKLLNTFKEI